MVIGVDALGTGVLGLMRLAAPIALTGTDSGFPSEALRSDLDRSLDSWSSDIIMSALSWPRSDPSLLDPFGAGRLGGFVAGGDITGGVAPHLETAGFRCTGFLELELAVPHTP